MLAIANYRLEPTEKTVITFNEVPVGAPETIRAWFYPGRSAGQEFVYPKRRALELAATSKVIVPAIAVDAENPDLKTVPIVAITPEQKEVAVASVIQSTPVLEQTQASAGTQNAREANGRQLPKTASSLGLMALLGLVFLTLATAVLMLTRRSRPVPASAP